MAKQIYFTLFNLLVAFVFIIAFLTTPILANAHEHEAEHDSQDSHEESQLEKMQTIVEVLQQLIVLITQQAEVKAEMHDEHMQTIETPSLVVREEVHDGVTHIHVIQDGVETKFFLDEVASDDKEGVIAGVVSNTELTDAEVRAVITFYIPEESEEHEHEEEVGHEHDDMEDIDEVALTGVHIMPDGSVMNGDGEAVAGAVINDDGTINLSDGTVITPVADFR